MVRHAPRYRRAASLSLSLSSAHRIELMCREETLYVGVWLLYYIVYKMEKEGGISTLLFGTKSSCLIAWIIYSGSRFGMFLPLSHSLSYMNTRFYTLLLFFLVGSSFSWSSGSSYWFMCKLFVLCRWSFFQSVVSCNLRRSRQYKHCIFYFYFYVDFNGYNIALKKCLLATTTNLAYWKIV